MLYLNTYKSNRHSIEYYRSGMNGKGYRAENYFWYLAMNIVSVDRYSARNLETVSVGHYHQRRSQELLDVINHEVYDLSPPDELPGGVCR